MTNDEIDKLEASKQLDEAVALAVGLKVVENTSGGCLVDDFKDEEVVDFGNGACRLFSPSTDWGDAMMAMERCDFNAKKLPVGLLYMFSRNAAGEKWYGFRINDDGFASGVCSNAQSGPLAICHAILKATRQEVRNDT